MVPAPTAETRPHGAFAPLEKQFYSFIYFKSANSFPLLTGDKRRGPRRFPVWAATGGCLIALIIPMMTVLTDAPAAIRLLWLSAEKKQAAASGETQVTKTEDVCRRGRRRRGSRERLLQRSNYLINVLLGGGRLAVDDL